MLKFLWSLKTAFWLDTVLLGGSLIEHRGLVSTSYVYRGTLEDGTVVPVAEQVVLAGTVLGIAASFSCSLFPLYSSCGVWTPYYWVVSALVLTLSSSTTIGGLYSDWLGGEKIWHLFGMCIILTVTLPDMGYLDSFSVMQRLGDDWKSWFHQTAVSKLSWWWCLAVKEGLHFTHIEPPGYWYHPHHFCLKAFWWYGPASQWNHCLLGSEYWLLPGWILTG